MYFVTILPCWGRWFQIITISLPKKAGNSSVCKHVKERKGDCLKKSKRAYQDKYLLIMMSENSYKSESVNSEECERLLERFSCFLMCF